MSKKKVSNNNIRLAGLFVVLVFGLIILSVIFKFLLLIRNSKFDGTHRFTIDFVTKTSSNIISFSPQNKSISLLKINGNITDKNISGFLEIPVDVIIYNYGNGLDNSKISSSLWRLFFDLDKHPDLNRYDVFRLALYAQTVSKSSVYEKNISADDSEEAKQALVSNLFQDTTINQENVSVEIINATNVYGLGNRLADLITRIGGNVVLVSSSDSASKYSKILYLKNKTYTVEKLGSFLGIIPQKSSQNGIADVIIIIGQDKLGNLNF